jgi:hypothetical protein
MPTAGRLGGFATSHPFKVVTGKQARVHGYSISWDLSEMHFIVLVRCRWHNKSALQKALARCTRRVIEMRGALIRWIREVLCFNDCVVCISGFLPGACGGWHTAHG